MITLRHYDAGTRLTAVAGGVPGMVEPRYLEVRMYETRLGDNAEWINEWLRQIHPGVEIAPWPEDMPRKAWVDVTNRYIDVDDGFRLVGHHYDQVNGDYAEIPGGQMPMLAAPDHEMDRGDGRIIRSLDWRDVREREGRGWIRLDTSNKLSGGLTSPAMTQIEGLHAGSRVALELPDNHLFAPFDLRHCDRYYAEDEDGALLTPAATALAGLVADGGSYRLYHRPRRWEYGVLMQVDYLYASFVESFVMSIMFSFFWYDRPPFWPYRHDILHTGDNPLGVDAAIYAAVNSTEATAMMRGEIAKLEFHTPCEILTFLGVQPAMVTVWRIPERAADPFLAIERYDRATGDAVALKWWRYRTNQDAYYPKRSIGYWEQVPIYITLDY